MADRQRTPYSIIPIQRQDVFRTVLERLQELISHGGVGAGDQLPSERDLARRLGVSRVSVRQALKVLESMGRVVIVTGTGTFVRERNNEAIIAHLLADRPFDLEFLRQLVTVRAAIDMAAFEAACERWQPDWLDRFRELLARHEAEIRAEGERPANNSLAFEALFGELSGNALLRRMQSLVHELWLLAWSRAGYAPGYREQLHGEHVAIMNRIACGDWERARQLINAHFDRQVGA